MPLAVAIPAAISAGTSIFKGIMGSRAAKGAARIQAEAAMKAGQLGTAAAAEAAEGITSAGQYAAEDVERQAGFGAHKITEAAEGAAQGVEGGVEQANVLLRDIYGEATDLTQPYVEAGEKGITSLAEFAQAPGEFEFTQDDPSYQWRLQEGLKALERSKAARGTLQSGSTLKGITHYAQNLASTEYGAAFDRFMRQREDRLNTLATLAGFGERGVSQQIGAGETYSGRAASNITRGAEVAGGFRFGGEESAAGMRLRGAESGGAFRTGAAESAGRFKITGAGFAADALTGAANARAAGKMGAANAWAGMAGDLGAIGQNIGSYYTLKDLLKTKP